MDSLVSIRLEFLCRDTNRYYRRRRSRFAKFTYLFPIVSDKNILLYEIGDFNLNAAQVVSISPSFYSVILIVVGWVLKLSTF
jgi:hypothetical protein